MAKIDLGKKLGDCITAVPMSADEKHYPDLYLDSDDERLGDLPDKGSCTIHYKVRSRTHREEKDPDGKTRRSHAVRLDVTHIEAPDKKKNGNGARGYGDDARNAAKEYFKDK
jgi:hypothetical protein